MRRDSQLFADPAFIHFHLYGHVEPEHHFSRYAQDNNLLRYFVRGVDLVTEYPLHTLFFTWSLSVLAMGSRFPTLAWMTVGIIGISLTYRWARGPKTLDPVGYQNYLGKLDDFPVASEMDRQALNAITWPRGTEEERFLSFHSRQMEYLVSHQQWDLLANLMGSIRQRFPLNDESGHLSLYLSSYVYKLHAYSSRLHSSDKKSILSNFLRHWLKQIEDTLPSASTALECASLLKPMSQDENLINLGQSSPNNTAAFLSLSQSEQQKIIDHLFAGDRRCLFVLVSLQLADDQMLSPEFMQRILEKFMLSQNYDNDIQESGYQMGKLLMTSLLCQSMVDVSPASAAWLCHLYGCGENIMRSLAKLYEDFDASSDHREALARHLLSRALQYVRLTPVPQQREPITPASVFYYPFLIRVFRVDQGKRVMGPYEPKNIADATDRKLMVVMGSRADKQSFMSELVGEEQGGEHRDPVKVSFYLALFSDFVSIIATDPFGGGDQLDGIRGRIFAFINGINSDLAETSFLIELSRYIGRNFTFFLLQALLTVHSISSKKKIHYFIKIIENYSQLQGESSVAVLIFNFQPVAHSFDIKNGVINLLLGWTDRLLASEDKEANSVAIDLLIDANGEGYEPLFQLAQGSHVRLLRIMSSMSDEQLQSYFQRLAGKGNQRLILNNLISCLWAQYDAKRPDRGWVVIVVFWYLFKKTSNDVNQAFDLLGFIEDTKRPFHSSNERFLVMNLLMTYLIKERSKEGVIIFLNFVQTCRAEDVCRHLPIFASVLSINNRQGPYQLQSWMTSVQMPIVLTHRIVAMLIFALHPPEYFAPYENNRGLFKKEPVLFFEEVQHILQAFQRPVDLNDKDNQGIVSELKTFGFPERWLNRLIMETTGPLNVVLKV